jgi:hypothetical protein
MDMNLNNVKVDKKDLGLKRHWASMLIVVTMPRLSDQQVFGRTSIDVVHAMG